MPPLRAFSLVCHRDMATTVPCLQSFVRRCRDPWRLSLVSDGSLTAGDAGVLRAALPTADLLEPADLEPTVGPALEQYPHCRRFREWCPWAKKLLDIPILADGAFAYIDSDILFRHDFTGLGDAPTLGFELAFMRGYANVYSASLRNSFPVEARLPRVNRLNAGLLYVGPEAFDLGFIERFLAESQGDKSPALWEQTAWACLAARVPSAHFSERQVSFPQACFDPRRKLRWSPVAVHFVGATRHLLAETLAAVAAQPPDPGPIRLTLERSSRLNTASQLVDLIAHRRLVRSSRRAGIHR